ncbi:MAG: two-component system response regulator MtrA [Planctomycetota bacterium]|jgi:two-component system response regulator MtrA
MQILLVEDDVRLGEQIQTSLVRAGFKATWITRGDEVLPAFHADFALVVLDLMLPGAYGLDVLKALREQSEVPILVLSAKQDASVRVRALELGADDYLTKPFWPDELLARVQARLRRPSLARAAEEIDVGELHLDLDARRVTALGAELTLTRVEYDLLLSLARRPGAAVERGWLAENILDPEREGTARTLDVHVSRLRKKLGPCSGYLATVWGVGYRLEPAPLA